jgi:hypothetical protein
MNVNMFPRQDISPQDSGEGGREGGAEGTVVETQCHAVDGGPEGAIGDGRAIEDVYRLPSLDYAREEDCSSYVCACELGGVLVMEVY